MHPSCLWDDARSNQPALATLCGVLLDSAGWTFANQTSVGWKLVLQGESTFLRWKRFFKTPANSLVLSQCTANKLKHLPLNLQICWSYDKPLVLPPTTDSMHMDSSHAFGPSNPQSQLFDSKRAITRKKVQNASRKFPLHWITLGTAAKAHYNRLEASWHA